MDPKALEEKARILEAMGEAEAAHAVRELLRIAFYYKNVRIDEHTATLAKALIDAYN